MEQSYPSLKASLKDVRFLVRRVNRCIRDIDLTLPDEPDAIQFHEYFPKISALISARAQQKIYERHFSELLSVEGVKEEEKGENKRSESDDDILNELLK